MSGSRADPLDAVEEGPVPLPSSSSGTGRPDCSLTALHEASHCIVGRYFGLPIAAVTVVASEHFFGRCLGPASNPDDSPEMLLAAAEAICTQALAARPLPGEDALEFAGPWFAHVASRMTELVAGFAGERLGGYSASGEGGSSDIAIAKVFAGTIAAPSAVPAYLDFCRRSAEAILRDHWPAVLSLAAELDARGTLDGADIDRIIEAAEFKVAREAELARRKKMAEMIASAENFLARTIGNSHETSNAPLKR